jgi:hypothetical protein
LIYLALLAITGELRLSSNAFVFFSIAWLVQSVIQLLQARRRAHPAP